VQDARRLLIEHHDAPNFDRAVVLLAGQPCLVLALAGTCALATWQALAAYETRQRGVSAARVPVLLHSSQSRLHAEWELAFFFNPKDAGLRADAPPTLSLADGALPPLGGDRIVGKELLVR
jgi:hypothetical protein